MKISIGTNIKDGPWGGGNLFAINLRDYLIENNHEVVTNLNDDDIDIILITEPRKTSESSAFTHIDVFNYLRHIKSDALIVHRINECDERKGTNYVNKYLINANKIADSTIFVSYWLKDIFEEQGINKKNNTVIYAGANKKIFNPDGFIPWDGSSKINFVTHHWGANWNKGFEAYIEIDNLISTDKWKDKLSFTYIGNLPKKFSFKNAKVIEPIAGEELAKELKKRNAYITGSINEPSGNHHIEAAQCGIPILYINSGGTPEYCNKFGIEYSTSNLEDKIEQLQKDYGEVIDSLRSYPHNASKMCEDYLKLFEEMYSNKKNYLGMRKYYLSSNVFSKSFYKLNRKINL